MLVVVELPNGTQDVIKSESISKDYRAILERGQVIRLPFTGFVAYVTGCTYRAPSHKEE